jgi:predicted acyltransferase
MGPNYENSTVGAKGCGKAAPWKSPKNGLSHLAWKSAHPADFHFPHSLGCYWNKRPFSNENEIHTNRPCQTLTYCRQKMVLTLGSTLDRRVEERHALGDCQ